jgi:predicted esterase
MQGVAILSLVLPGDGNRGWEFAASGRSPRRSETVQALADVLKVAKRQFLANNGKLILRGGSAGGWLSAKTALLNPDLVDEVIAISAAYSFESGDDAVRLANFFAVSDSIKDEEVAYCGKTFFRLIHGSEDQVIPLDRVKRFGSMMSANKCTGALHIAVGGDHNLADFRDFATNLETKKIVLWTYGFEE